MLGVVCTGAGVCPGGYVPGGVCPGGCLPVRCLTETERCNKNAFQNACPQQ